MVTVTNADSALKSFYLDAVKEALDFKTNPLLAQFQRTTANVVGKDVRRSVRYGLNGGIGAGSETGDLPEAADNNRVEFVTGLKNLYGTIEISDKALRASANSEGAFVNLLNDEMQSLIQSASFNFGRMLFGDGSAFIAKVEDLPDTYTAKVDNTSAIMEGMYVDFYSAQKDIADLAQKRKVLSVDRVNGTVTVDGAPLTETMDLTGYIALHNSKDYEITGLEGVFENETLYGVDRTGSFMKPYVAKSVGEISENVIQKAIDTIEEAAGSKINFIVCSWGVKRALVEYYRALGVVLPTMEIAGGFKALSFNGIPVVADRFCPKGTMYLLNTEDFKLHQLCDWKWLEGEDGKILKQVPGKPVYTATLVKYAELMCDRPSGQGKLSGITEK